MRLSRKKKNNRPSQFFFFNIGHVKISFDNALTDISYLKLRSLIFQVSRLFKFSILKLLCLMSVCGCRSVSRVMSSQTGRYMWTLFCKNDQRVETIISLSQTSDWLMQISEFISTVLYKLWIPPPWFLYTLWVSPTKLLQITEYLIKSDNVNKVFKIFFGPK